MNGPQKLLTCGLATTMIVLSGVGGYVHGVRKTRAQAAERLYVPFNKQGHSTDLSSPSRDLLKLQWKAAREQERRDNLPSPDPEKELKTLERIYRFEKARDYTAPLGTEEFDWMEEQLKRQAK